MVLSAGKIVYLLGNYVQFNVIITFRGIVEIDDLLFFFFTGTIK